jgi:ParB-like chromosome segregation protein Spo0J
MTSRSHKAGDLQVKYRAVAALIPFAKNPRTHSDAQVAEITASIREFGFTNPILIDGANGIIAGHGRLLAARQLGMTTVPVIELAGLSEAQKRAYVIADNKLALNAGWDNDLLALELGDLQGLGFDLALTGFSDDELAGLLSVGTAGLTDPTQFLRFPSIPSAKRATCGASVPTGFSAATARRRTMWRWCWAA